MAGRVTPRAPEVQRSVHDAQRMEIHTSLPARVVSYDRATQTIEAEFMVQEVSPALEDEDEDTVAPYPNVVSVPVAGMRLGSLVIHSDLRQGEEVWICFTEADLNRWRETGQISDPGVQTRHGLAGCWAVPGAFSRPNALTGLGSKPMIGTLEGSLIEWDGLWILVGGDQSLALATETDNQLAAIAADLNTIKLAVNAIAGGALPDPLQIVAARLANDIASTITKGA